MNGAGKVQRERIPDVFDQGSVVSDCKMVAEQSYDEQMRDNTRIASADNVRIKGQPTNLTKTLRFDLLVSGPSDQYPNGTHVTKQLIAAIGDAGGDIWEITDP